MDGTSSEIRAGYHALVRSDIFPLVPVQGGTLLDIGGGIGATASALKSSGHVERAGVIDLVSHDPGKLGLDFHYSGNLEEPGFLESITEKEGPFSTILCLDVLEHISDPWSLIAALHKSLAPGGVIVASIPNMRHYKASFPLFFQGRWDLEDSGIRDRTHLRWFVRDTAIGLMTSSGLQLEEIREATGAGRKITLIRTVTFGILRSFTTLQYLIRARKAD